MLEFGRWASRMTQEATALTTHALLAHLKEVIEEHEPIPLLAYAQAAWEVIKEDSQSLELLRIAVSAGYIRNGGERSRRLANLGLLIEKPGKRNLLYPANKLIELFVRQRLAEQGLVMPIEQSTVWTMPRQSASAYQVIMEIENHLRNFIGDALLKVHGPNWAEVGLGKAGMEGMQSVVDRAKKRQEMEQDGIYVAPDIADPLLTYLDFSDLALIVRQMKDTLPGRHYREATSFLGRVELPSPAHRS